MPALLLTAPPQLAAGPLSRDFRFASDAAPSYDAEAHTIDGVLSAGSPVSRYGYIEMLNMAPEAVNMSRIHAGQCRFLDTHNSSTIDAILGVIENGRIENGELVGTIRFAQTPEGQKAEGMAARGEIKGISVGYSVEKWTLASEDDMGVQTWRADQWTVLEASACAVPADSAAMFRGIVTSGSPSRIAPNNEENMPHTAVAAAPAVVEENAPAATRAATAEAPAQALPAPVTERAASDAPTLTIKEALDLQRLAGAMNIRSEVDTLIAAGLSRTAINAKMLDLVAERQAGNKVFAGPVAHITRDEGDTLRQAVASAITLRANPGAIGRKTPEDIASREMAHKWRGMKLLETFRCYAEETQGVKLRGLSPQEMATLALGLRDEGLMSRAGLSTSDFPSILANVASKRLRDAYSTAPQPWRMLGRQSNAPDFKPKSVVALAGMPAFELVKEGGEFKYGKFTDGGESYSLATYGKIVPITRQALINDDLGAFDRIPTIIGRAAAELENSVVWGLFSTNANLADGNAWFSSAHKNLGTAGDVTETTLGEAERLMLEQLDATGQPFAGLIPMYLIVTPKRKVAAQKLLTAVQATATSGVNPFANRLELIVDARLKPLSGAEPWYVVGDPSLLDTFEYAYLDGQEGVYTEQRVGFEIDGLEIKGRLDFAAKAIDFRNVVSNAGV